MVHVDYVAVVAKIQEFVVVVNGKVVVAAVDIEVVVVVVVGGNVVVVDVNIEEDAVVVDVDKIVLVDDDVPEFNRY